MEAGAVGAVGAFCLVLIVGFAIDGFQVWVGWPPLGTQAMFDGFWFCTVSVVLTDLCAAMLHQAGERPLHSRYRPAASMWSCNEAG